MNDRLHQVGFSQTAFTQVAGELRSRALFRRECVIAAPTPSELPIVGVGDWWVIRYLIRLVHRTIQGPKGIQSP